MRTRLPHVTTALAALACTLAATAPALGSGDRSAPQQPTPYDDPSLVGQTSDGLLTFAPPMSSHPRPTARRTVFRRDLAPGVELTRFDLSGPRPNRALLLTLDLSRTRVGIDYTAPPRVAGVAPIVQTLRADPASRQVVAGVNGDFYDIGDTGAPLGLGKDRQRGLLHGPLEGWNSAFYVDRGGRARIGTLGVRTHVGRHPHLRVTNLNSPYVAIDGIGVYTRAWGPSPGATVTAGSSRGVRVVAIRRGRVVATGRSFSPVAPSPAPCSSAAAPAHARSPRSTSATGHRCDGPSTRTLGWRSAATCSCSARAWSPWSRTASWPRGPPSASTATPARC